MSELQQVLALLAYGPETTCRPYQVRLSRRARASPPLTPNLTQPARRARPQETLRPLALDVAAVPLPHDLPLAALAPLDPAAAHVPPSGDRLAQDAHLRPRPARRAHGPAVGVPARRETPPDNDHPAGRDRPRGACARARLTRWPSSPSSSACLLPRRAAEGFPRPLALARARDPAPGPRPRGVALALVPPLRLGAARPRPRGPLLAPRQLDHRVPLDGARRRGGRRRGRAARRAREQGRRRREGLLEGGACSGLSSLARSLVARRGCGLLTREELGTPTGFGAPRVAAPRGQARRARHGRGLRVGRPQEGAHAGARLVLLLSRLTPARSLRAGLHLLSRRRARPRSSRCQFCAVSPLLPALSPASAPPRSSLSPQPTKRKREREERQQKKTQEVHNPHPRPRFSTAPRRGFGLAYFS